MFDSPVALLDELSEPPTRWSNVSRVSCAAVCGGISALLMCGRRVVPLGAFSSDQGQFP